MVSVIVPTHDAEKYIERTIYSILHQSYNEIEVIAVDDASKDSTIDLLTKLQESDRRIRILPLKFHAGAANSRLEGVRISKGEWIMFVDDDDTLPKYSIETLIKFDNGRRDIISGNIALNSKIIPNFLLEGDINPKMYIQSLLDSTSYIGSCAKLFRTTLFHHEIKMPQSIILNEDILMNTYLAKNAHCVFIANNVIGYNYNQRTDSNSRIKFQSLNTWLMLFKLMENCVENYNDNNLRQSLALFILHRIYHFCIQRGKFVSIKNPQIKNVLNYCKLCGIEIDSNKEALCIKSPLRQRLERIKYLIVNTIKIIGRYILVKSSLLGKNYILKNLY